MNAVTAAHSHALQDRIRDRTDAHMRSLLKRTFGAAALPGYRFVPQVDEVASFVQDKDPLAVKALAYLLEAPAREELRWFEPARLGPAARENLVNDLIVLLQGLDLLLVFQAEADVECFVGGCEYMLPALEVDRVYRGVLGHYRWKYIVSGLRDARFRTLLGSMVGESEVARLEWELAPITHPFNQEER